MLWIIALGLVGTGLAGAFALALCRAAADGDRAAANFATTGDDERIRWEGTLEEATPPTPCTRETRHEVTHEVVDFDPCLPPIRVPRGGVYHGKIDLDEIERYANQHGPSG